MSVSLYRASTHESVPESLPSTLYYPSISTVLLLHRARHARAKRAAPGGHLVQRRRAASLSSSLSFCVRSLSASHTARHTERRAARRATQSKSNTSSASWSAARARACGASVRRARRAARAVQHMASKAGGSVGGSRRGVPSEGGPVGRGCASVVWGGISPASPRSAG
jgi:hypothetical protein